jgi:hypothetical protein
MRVSIFTAVVAAVAGVAASPVGMILGPFQTTRGTDNSDYTDIKSRSLITKVGSLVSDLEDGLGVTEITAKLDDLLGNSLTKVCLILVSSTIHCICP